MTRLHDWAAQTLADPLGHARAAPRAIGTLGFDIPEDLLAAPGIAACHLPWRLDRTAPRARQWIEPSFAPWIWSIVEDWAEGRFDFLEAVVFTRGDDSAQRLYYYISELQRVGEIGGPRPLIYDVAMIPKPGSVDRTVQAVRTLAIELGIDAEGLRAGIDAANRRRSAMAALEAGRAGEGALYARAALASLFAPLPEDVEVAAAAPPRGRVLLAGTPTADDRLHRAVDASGWAIVAEAHPLSLLRLGDPITPGDHPFAAVGAHAHALPYGKRSFVDRAAWIVAEARRARADAVVLWLYEEEEALPWHVPGQCRALEAAGIPVLALTRRDWSGDDGAADEITAFLKDLNP